jgi:L-rhamnose isomerase
MAEIKIEKKKPIWPWVLGIIALVILLTYLFIDDREKNEIGAQETETAMQVTPNESVDDGTNGDVEGYVRFIETDTVRMGLDHNFTNEALRRLTAATKAVAAKIDYDVQSDLSEVKQYADKVATDPFETTHANSIRKAADVLSGTLQKMQRANFPELNDEATELKKAASSIDPDALTLDQKEAVRTYFDKAADLLQKMN